MTATPRSRHVLAALAATLVLSSVSGAQAAPAAVSTRTGTLTTGTTITWSGAKGLRLRVPSDATLPTYGARLFLSGGTYAHVRIVHPDPRCPYGQCGLMVVLDYTRATAAAWSTSDGAGADHLALVANDKVMPEGTYDVYLFTDGEARMTFDRTELPRAPRTYRAAGRIAGGAAVLPIHCPTAGCDARDGYGGRLRAGGMQVDVGRVGYVATFVGSGDRARPPLWQYPQSRYGRGCVYPRSESDPTSTDPADHPLGCEVVGDDLEATVSNAIGTGGGSAGLVPIYSGYYTGVGRLWASGKVYVGHQVLTSHGVSDPHVVAFAVWFAYGIR